MRRSFWKRSETWGLGLAASTLVVMTVFILAMRNAALQARAQLDRTQQIDKAATNLLVMELDAETGQRGYVLTGDPSYLAPYTRAVDGMDHQLALLRRLLSEDAEQAARFTQLEALTRKKLAEMKTTVDLRRTKGFDAALRIVQEDSGRRTMDEVRAILLEVDQRRIRQQAARRATLNYYQARIPIYLGGGSAVIVLLLAGAFVVIRREADGRERAVELASENRRKAESARDLLDLTLRSIGDAVITADAAGRVTMLNAAAQRLTGWGDAAIGRDVHEVFRIVGESTREPVESALEKIRRGGSVAGMANHTLLIRNDGSEIPIEESGAPVRGHGGEIAGFVLVFRDVTERRKSEEALRRSERRFRTLANAAPALLWLADRNGEALFFNRPWLEFTGCGEEQQLGWGWMGRVHTDDAGIVREQFDRGVSSKAPFGFEARLRRADGAWRNMLCSVVPYESPRGEHAGFVTACFDFTELKEAQRSLEINEQRFRSLVSGTTLMVWHTDTAGFYVTPQPQWEEFTGQRWPEYAKSGALQVIHPADREALIAAWEKALETRKSFALSYRLWHHATQSWRHVTARGTPLIGPNGEVLEWIGAMTDETERRRLEDRLREAAKLESLAVLAGGVAHDFNNLLVGILGNASLLESSLTDPVERELAREVVRAGERAAALTHQMLAYSGRGRFVVQEADLSAEIERLEPRLREIIPAHVRLTLGLARDLPPCEADRAQIEQLLWNLVQNAAEAIAGTGGEVIVSTAAETLPRGAGGFLFGDPIEAGRYVVLEVRDDGEGMDAATQSRIFDPFFSTRFTGRGLGLPVVLGIVRGHKGGIRIESRAGEGSAFRIYLPACKARPGERRALPAGALAGRDPRPGVLVVDDEDMVRSFVTNALQRYGFRVVLAEDGARALEIMRAAAGEIAVVLLDLTMPRMNGQETLAALREISPQVPVVASSGYSGTDALERFGRTPEAFIQKPYSAKHLASVIRSVLDRMHDPVLEKTIQ